MTEKTLQAAREHWALGDAPITLIAARENHVYRVNRPEGPVALRIHRPGYRTLQELDSELLWMEMLATNGINVPKPIPATDGSHYQTVDGTTTSLLSWLDGTPLSKLNATPQMYFDLGRTLSKMHALADTWDSTASFSRPTWNLTGDNPTWGRFWENPQLTQEQAGGFLAFRDAVREILKNKNMAPLDVGLIHADLIPDNVLFNGSELQLIDFDDGGFGYRLFDLATITRHNRIVRPDDTLANATIDGYCTDRQIDRDALLLFEALRACTYVGWNITRMDEPAGRERNARYIAEAEMAINQFWRYVP